MVYLHSLLHVSKHHLQFSDVKGPMQVLVQAVTVMFAAKMTAGQAGVSLAGTLTRLMDEAE